jgi:peptidoglycan/LPS O-acetylase OafA/YrhL
VAGTTGLAITTLGNLYLVPRGLNLYCTVVGHLPVLCLGIYAARAARLPTELRVVLAAAIVFALGTWFKWFWYFAPICAALLLLAIAPGLIRCLRAWPSMYRFVRYCGAISLPLFAIHGMLRLPFRDAANAEGTWYFTLAMAFVFLLASLAAAQVMLWIENGGRRWLSTARAGAH